MVGTWLEDLGRQPPSRNGFGEEPVQEVVVAALRTAERERADLGRAVRVHDGVRREPEESLNPGADRRIEHLAVRDDPSHRARMLAGAFHRVDDAGQDRRRAVQHVRLERQHRLALLDELRQTGVVDVEAKMLEDEMG